MAIADADGLAKVSMRSVARDLGVEAMSLYHHVSNKDALLDAMVDAVHGEFHEPVVGGEWRVELATRSRSGREALKRHPWAVGLMDARTNAGLATLSHHDAVLGCLRTAGFSIRLTGHAFATLDAHLYGFLVQELSMPITNGDADLEEVAAQVIDTIPNGVMPWLKEFAVERVLQPGYDFGEEFDIGLDLILDGLERRLTEEQRATPSG
ncbi:MAG: TetR family transcriptional regulator [Nocardioides sp.]|nr:TetR family transcriptional regulator [Nocardioides sp.]